MRYTNTIHDIIPLLIHPISVIEFPVLVFPYGVHLVTRFLSHSLVPVQRQLRETSSGRLNEYACTFSSRGNFRGDAGFHGEGSSGGRTVFVVAEFVGDVVFSGYDGSPVVFGGEALLVVAG